MPRNAVAAEGVEIAGPAGRLDARIETPSEPRALVAVVCHPHPLHGGTMSNKVVTTLSRTFHRLGATAVRFDFRGVGRSAGKHAHGAGEVEDTVAAARWVLDARPGSALVLAGFSFGAAVAAAAAHRLEPAALVGVALPVARLPPGFEPAPCPWLLVHGVRDEIVPLADVERWRAEHAPEARLAVIDEATHFFHGKLHALATEVERFTVTALPPSLVTDRT